MKNHTCPTGSITDSFHVLPVSYPTICIDFDSEDKAGKSLFPYLESPNGTIFSAEKDEEFAAIDHDFAGGHSDQFCIRDENKWLYERFACQNMSNYLSI